MLIVYNDLDFYTSMLTFGRHNKQKTCLPKMDSHLFGKSPKNNNKYSTIFYFWVGVIQYTLPQWYIQ